jgi:predicted DNA-binding transcriptional regulator AlpA
MPKRYLRKAHLRTRYGDVTYRTIERMVKDGALPPPEFPLGNRIPAWDEAVLDKWDQRQAVVDAAAARAAKLKTKTLDDRTEVTA